MRRETAARVLRTPRPVVYRDTRSLVVLSPRQTGPPGGAPSAPAEHIQTEGVEGAWQR
jgi:hypothetical protein